MRCAVHGSAPASSVSSSNTKVSTSRPLNTADLLLGEEHDRGVEASTTSVMSSPMPISAAPRIALNTHGSPGVLTWMEPPGKVKPRWLAMSKMRSGVSVGVPVSIGTRTDAPSYSKAVPTPLTP
jgi:hypothetical protein